MEQGQVVDLEPGLKVILAPNPSSMTHEGTLTYILGHNHELAVIDPGPDIPQHQSAIMNAVGSHQAITTICVTHAHLDHSALANSLSLETGAPVYGFGPYDAGRTAIMQHLAETGLAEGGEGVDYHFHPNKALAEGALIPGDGWTLRAHWTPGHMANHLSFEWCERHALFCGDLIMGWSSSLISPPDGNLEQFYTSLRKVEKRPLVRLYPAHGSPVENPKNRIDWLRQHRHLRSVRIANQLNTTPQNISDLTSSVYSDVAPKYWQIAQRNLFAHLIWMVEIGYAQAVPELSFQASYHKKTSHKKFSDFLLDANIMY